MGNTLLEKKLYDTVSSGRQAYSKRLNESKKLYESHYDKKMPVNLQKFQVDTYSAICNEADGLLGFGVQADPNKLYESKLDESKKLYEDSGVTIPSNFGDSFVKHVFDIVDAFAVAPTLEDFVTVQSMDKRWGEVYYEDFIKSSDKAPTTSGDYYVNAKGEIQTDYTYSSENVRQEVMAVGTTATNYTGTLSWIPIKVTTESYDTNEFTIVAGGVTGSVNSAGTVSGTGISGTVNLTSGAFDITFTAAPDGETIYATYVYDSTKSFTKAPTIEAKFRSEVLFAARRTLNMKWLVDSAMIYDKDFGRDMEQEMIGRVINRVLDEIGAELAFDQLLGATAGGDVTFSTTVPDVSIPYTQHRLELLKTLGGANRNIKKSTGGLVSANYVIAGNDLMEVVEGLPTDVYEPIEFGEDEPEGIHTVGTFRRKYKIIENLHYADDRFLVGSKNSSWRRTGHILAWYIPIMVTELFHTTNLGAERDLVSWYAKKIVNGAFYNTGTVS